MLKPAILGAALVALLTSTSVDARDAMIGLSPHQSQEALKSLLERVMGFVMETVEPGEEAVFFDAANVKRIATFKVPDGKAYANPRAKLQANAKALGSLKRFIEGAEPLPGREASIDLPGFLRTIGEHYAKHDGDAGNDGGPAVIVMGSPIHHDLKALSLSMEDGYVPSDGHIRAGLGASPFGTKGLSSSLDGLDVHFGLTVADDQWRVSAQHGFAVERFWTLSVEARGGNMAYFGADIETMLDVAKTDAPDRGHTVQLGESDRLFMIGFAPDQGRSENINDMEPEAEPASQPVWQRATKPTIAITWDCDRCDVDLYVKPSADAEAIYYANPKTADGRLYKDFTRSPHTNGFELITLNGVVDLSKVWVAANFYQGRTSSAPLQGEMRVLIGDEVWAAPFTIAGRSGNKGKDRDQAIATGDAPNGRWTILDPIAVVTQTEE